MVLLNQTGTHSNDKVKMRKGAKECAILNRKENEIRNNLKTCFRFYKKIKDIY
jgi:hypothetical protein